MKRTLLLLTILFLVHGLKAQDMDQEPDVKYIFKNSTELKGFGSFDIKATRIISDPANSQDALLIGATGGVTVNKYLIFGLGGYGIATKATIQGTNPDKPLRLYGGYGGAILGFNLFPRQVVHLSFPILIGAGTIYLEDETFFNNSPDPEYVVEKSSFFVAEPTALLEVNITSFFRLGLGVGYRYVDGLDMQNLSSRDLTDWTGTAVFKFGRF